MKLLCPDVVVTADEREWFESFVRTSGFERNNSSGIAYVLLAQAMLAPLNGFGAEVLACPSASMLYGATRINDVRAKEN